MSRPIIIRKGSSNIVKAIDSESEKTITNFGTQYHFLNDIKKNIVINGYITQDSSKGSAVKYINLGITPTRNTRLELYIHNMGTNMGNGGTNLGLTNENITGQYRYPDNNDWRFFWADVPGIYFDMGNRRINDASNFRNSNNTNRMMKVECGRKMSNNTYYHTMKLTRYSDDYVIYNGQASGDTGDYTWSNATLLIEPYHSNGFYMCWYLIRIYEGEQKIMELYPAQKPGYGWCFMDNVSGNYFYNPDAPAWIYTKSSESIIIEN